MKKVKNLWRVLIIEDFKSAELGAQRWLSCGNLSEEFICSVEEKCLDQPTLKVLNKCAECTKYKKSRRRRS